MSSRTLQRMFDRVPGSYDRWNRLLTLGLDERWRRQAAALCLADGPRRVLDLCTGTGDLALWLRGLAAAGTRVEALDFSRRMLAQAQRKVPRGGSATAAARSDSGAVGWVQADAAAMPYADARFDAVGIAFAFRNLTFAHPARDRFLAEIRRVLRPGGRLVIAETSQPGSRLLRGLFHAYLDVAAGHVAAVASGHRAAYRYLAYSARHYHDSGQILALLGRSGFCQAEAHPRLLSAVSLYVAVR